MTKIRVDGSDTTVVKFFTSSTIFLTNVGKYIYVHLPKISLAGYEGREWNSLDEEH